MLFYWPIFESCVIALSAAVSAWLFQILPVNKRTHNSSIVFRLSIGTFDFVTFDKFLPFIEYQ